MKNNLPWGLRVRERRVAADLTQDELAERAGTTKATISKIERSTGQPKGDWIERLARALNVSEVELAYGASAAPQQPTLLPVIGMIAAGNWREAILNPEDRIPVPGAKPHMFVLRVDGDSIDRIAPHGTYVSIDPADPVLAEGGLFAVQNNQGEATLKLFRRSPDRLEPSSTNPRHKPIMLGSEPITIVGRATSVTQML